MRSASAPTNIATTNTLSASNNLVNLFGTPIVGGITYSWETSPTGATWTNHGAGGTFFPGATGLGGVFVRADANFTDASASPQHVPSLAVHYLLDDATGHTLTGIAASTSSSPRRRRYGVRGWRRRLRLRRSRQRHLRCHGRRRQ